MRTALINSPLGHSERAVKTLLNQEHDLRLIGGRINAMGPDGRWYDKSVQISESGGRHEIWRDITGERERIMQQKAMEERYSVAMQAANEGLIEWNASNGEIYLSARAEVIIMGEGCQSDFVPDTEKRLRQVILTEDHDMFYGGLRAHLKGEQPIFRCEIRTTEPAVPNRWLRLQGLALRDATGKAERVAGFIADITEDKNNQLAMRLAKEEAEIANRTKTEFFANMSHELRTPLNAVIGFSEIIRDQTFGPLGVPQYSEYVDDILSSGQHLLAVINDILDVSKAEAGKLELEENSFAIPSAFKSCLRLVTERAAKQGLEIGLEIEDGLPWLHGDERKFKQMILNLLSNSIKFTDAGGLIRLSAHNRDGCISVSVEDSGVGMDELGMEQAVIPFGQVDSTLARKHEGTGLGLPIVISMADLHGAEFDMSSKPNEGTTITITFPIERSVEPI